MGTAHITTIKEDIHTMKSKTEYEIRQIDAIREDDGWMWNTSYSLGCYEAIGADHKRSFLRALHRLGIVCKRGACRVEYDGDVYELVERSTGMPMFAAIPTGR